MAITTQAGVRTGLRRPNLVQKIPVTGIVTGRGESLWGTAGSPNPGTWDGTLNGVALSASSAQVLGQTQFTDPASGNSYLANARFGGNQDMMLLVCDRLWHNGGLVYTSTSQNVITSPQWPDRDIAGGHTGDGVLIALEVESALGAGALDPVTLQYTNQSGTTGKTAVLTMPAVTALPFGSFLIFGLAAGDTGVRAVEGVTFGAAGAAGGNAHLVAFRPLLHLPVPSPRPAYVDEIGGGFQRMYNGSVPFLVLYGTSAPGSVAGAMTVTQG